MARVQPFRAWRYASDTLDITSLTAPPYDVISPEQRTMLAKDPHNVVALELPEGDPDPSAPTNRYSAAAHLWDEWRENGVLSQDAEPALYVLEQSYRVSGRPVTRRALIAEVGLEPFSAGVILPHERTLPKALGDRFELIKSTAANFSQVFGLFEDPDCHSDAWFDAVIAGPPVAMATDGDGVRSTLWATSDAAIIAEVGSFMSSRRLYIADGHHRYTTALAYRDERRTESSPGIQTGERVQDPAYDSILMALVNMDDPDLSVLSYNRICDAEGPFDAEEFKAALGTHFDVSPLPPGHPSGVLDGFSRPAMLVMTRQDERPLLAVLKADVDPTIAIATDHSDAWKHLDVAALQELVLWPLLGIHPDRPETLDRISFTKDAHEAFKATGEHDVAFVLRPTRLDQLREVSHAGETMPQKSTYFYPKLMSGLLFRSAR